MHLVYTPKLIFIPIYCHLSISSTIFFSLFFFSLVAVVVVVHWIAMLSFSIQITAHTHTMPPYSFKGMAPYILLYFIEIISLLSFPFYLFNEYILFIFIRFIPFVASWVCVSLNWMGWFDWRVWWIRGLDSESIFITSHCLLRSQAHGNEFALLAEMISAIFREVYGFDGSAFKWHMMCYAWILKSISSNDEIKLTNKKSNEMKRDILVPSFHGIVYSEEERMNEKKNRFGFIHVRTIRGWKQLKWRHAFQNMVLMVRARLLTHSLTRSLVRVSSRVNIFRLFRIRKSGTCTKSIQWQNKTMTTWCRKWNETRILVLNYTCEYKKYDSCFLSQPHNRNLVANSAHNIDENKRNEHQ